MEPIRTCVGCRQRDSVGQLIKVVTEGNQFSIDSKRKLGGRGAWFHPHCGDLVLTRRGLQRALGDASTASLEAWLRNQAEKNG
ncbi:MAG: YlxR family protein [Aquiluna sp.]|uniref:YlxR family protein n=1 Tax=Aquiluna sp. TaxID=2053504 RepID=UPI00276FD104|nr:YlxR family protein [Aquiluna sp.]MDP4886751.1 YlxR family protein [Aquiluna sp.]MDP5025466.1 YlxR family protein [Aquiluna sp.]